MVRRSFRRGLRLGLLVGIAVAVVKVMQAWRANEEPPPYVAPPSPWPPVDRATVEHTAAKPAEPEPVMDAATFVEAPAVVEATPQPRRERPLKAAPSPAPAKKRATKKAAAPAVEARIWVEPSGAVCPPSHPIKAKLSSKLFHLPGMLAYDRCKPDRCYATEPDAVADGLQKAKR
jgi:hypothetical protein